MSIQIELNKDIDTYKTGQFKGLTLKEIIFSALTLGSGCGITFICNHFFKIPVEIAIYFALPVSAVIALSGFYRYNDMTFLEKIKRVLIVTYSKPYVYETEEEFLHLNDVEKVVMSEKHADVKKEIISGEDAKEVEDQGKFKKFLEKFKKRGELK